MKNNFFYLFLILSLGATFYYYRDYFFPEKPFPTIEDRLPDAKFLGRINVTEFADELTPLLFHEKVAYRDMIASDFILSQTKNTGINLQKPAYFYITAEDDFGALFNVSDSSKVPRAIHRIKAFFDVHDTIVNSHIIYKINKFNLYICYERNWFFVYRGNKFVKNYFQVKYADHTSMRKSWRKFLYSGIFPDEKLVLFHRSKEMYRQRLDYVAMAMDVDTSNVYVKSVIADRDYFPIQWKEKGISLNQNNSDASYFLDLQLNIDSLRGLKNHFIYSYLQPITQKYGFPLREFIDAWNGDLSINLGGKSKVSESYVETEFDDDFNPVEVKKQRIVEREMFTSVMSVTSNFRVFMNKMFAKGFIRKVNEEYFFLMSPPISLVNKPDLFYMYTAKFPELDTVNARNYGRITWENTPFNFKIDSITQKQFYFNVSIPFSYLDKKYAIPH